MPLSPPAQQAVCLQYGAAPDQRSILEELCQLKQEAITVVERARLPARDADPTPPPRLVLSCDAILITWRARRSRDAEHKAVPLCVSLLSPHRTTNNRSHPTAA